MTNMTTTWTRYIGYWCDNCRTVWSFRPESGTCKDCGARDAAVGERLG